MKWSRSRRKSSKKLKSKNHEKPLFSTGSSPIPKGISKSVEHSDDDDAKKVDSPVGTPIRPGRKDIGTQLDLWVAQDGLLGRIIL